jgi:hypothetical protein
MNTRSVCSRNNDKKVIKKEKNTETKYLVDVEKENQIMQFDNVKEAFLAKEGNEDAIDKGCCAEDDFHDDIIDSVMCNVLKVTIIKKVLTEPEGYKKCPCGHGWIKK